MGRRPMQWSASGAAGFSSVQPWIAPDLSVNNVAAESDDPDSLLAHYRRLVNLRRQHPALRTGALTRLAVNPAGCFASLRVDGEDIVLVWVNLTGRPLNTGAITLAASAIQPGSYRLLPLLGSEMTAEVEVNVRGGFDSPSFEVALGPFSSIILQLISD